MFGLTDAWHCQFLKSHLFINIGLHHNQSAPTVWCCCQQAKTEKSYTYEVTSSYGKQLTVPGILGSLEMGEGTVFCVARIFW